MAKNENDKIRDIANAAVLVLISRASAPLLCGICTWILVSVSHLKEDVATAMAQIGGVDTRIATIENWRNSIDAIAGEPRR